MFVENRKSLWSFRAPEIYYGIGSLEALNDVEFNHCFIVTDEGVVRFGLFKILEKKLKDLNKKFTLFSEVEPDPTEQIVLKGLEVCKSSKPDLIIGLGGGSSIDTAKAIWVLYERPDLSLKDISPFMHLNIGKKAKLVAIPTTSGTGAEVTWAAVITKKEDSQGELKMELANKEIIPDVAIIDPVFTKTLPPNPTASTAIDAVSHIYEGIVSVFTNEFSYALGLSAMEHIRKYLPIAYRDGSDMVARDKLHIAATMAGLCLGNAQITAAHSLGHALGAIFHVPHGSCVGVFLPYVLEFYINDPNKKTEKILARFSKQLGLAEWTDTKETACKKAINDIRSLMAAVQFPRKLPELNLTKEKIEKNLDLIVQKTLQSPSLLLSPRIPNEEQIRKIINYALEGKSIDF